MWGRVAAKIGRRGCMTIATILHIIFFVAVIVCDSNKVLAHLKGDGHAPRKAIS
jgi:hypothetical protein